MSVGDGPQPDSPGRACRNRKPTHRSWPLVNPSRIGRHESTFQRRQQDKEALTTAWPERLAFRRPLPAPGKPRPPQPGPPRSLSSPAWSLKAACVHRLPRYQALRQGWPVHRPVTSRQPCKAQDTPVPSDGRGVEAGTAGRRTEDARPVSGRSVPPPATRIGSNPEPVLSTAPAPGRLDLSRSSPIDLAPLPGPVLTSLN